MEVFLVKVVQFKKAKLLKICKYLVEDFSGGFEASRTLSLLDEELDGFLSDELDFASLSLLDVELNGFLSVDDDVLDGSLLVDLKLK
jgi:hypothetical protein